MFSPSQDPLYTPGSPYLKEKSYFEKYMKKDSHAKKCSICATLYKNSKFSYTNVPPKIVAHTDTSLFIKFDKNKTSGDRCEVTLLYGSSFRHTNQNLDPIQHEMTQFTLLYEAYNLFASGHSENPKGENVVLYIKLTNYPSKSKFSNSMRTTHPHVWIVDFLPNYNGKSQYFLPNDNESLEDFFNRMVRTSNQITRESYPHKTYLKFNIRSKDLKVTHAEVDVCFD